MKKVVAILFAVLFLLGVTACQKASAPNTSPDFNAKTDYNVSYAFLEYTTSMIETEDGYYYVTHDHYLRFIDKLTMKDIVLCSKPECTHTENDQDICTAYLGVFSPNQLFYYNQEIYCFVYDETQASLGFHDVYLSRISKDGSSCEKVWEIQWKGHSGYFQTGVLHRGVYYFYVSQENDMTVYAYDLKKDRCDKIYSSDRFGSNLTPIGNYVYWRHLDPNTLKSQMIQYEISTEKIKTIDGPWKVTLCGDALLFEEYKKEEKRRIFSIGQRTSSDLAKIELFVDGGISGDGRYLYSFPSTEDDFSIEVLDVTTYQEISRLEIKEQLELFGVYRLLPGSGEKLFLVNIHGEPIFYAYKSAIGTPDFQWFEVEKVN